MELDFRSENQTRRVFSGLIEVAGKGVVVARPTPLTAERALSMPKLNGLCR
jgi:hypothetical protein